MKALDWPLMRNNITIADRNGIGVFLGLQGLDWRYEKEIPQLTNGPQVRAFEEEFAAWHGSKYAVMVNSGSSANLITMAAVHALIGPHQVLVPCVTWVSDIAAILQSGMEPCFADISLDTLGIDWASASDQPRVHFPTHCLGFDAGAAPIAPEILIEDCCEALGATREGKKLGTFGFASNFSFYYAHHMSTIEGGMVCTDDHSLYQILRRLRSHGLVREMEEGGEKSFLAKKYSDLDPNFIFMEPAYNVRSTELNAVIGRSQLKRVDDNNNLRTNNLLIWLLKLDPDKYLFHFKHNGSSNYALPLVLREPNVELMAKVISLLRELNVECRRGTAGGGNQLRQPYARKRWGNDFHKQFPNAEHVHQFGLYIGNYPDLETENIEILCEELNKL